MREITPGLLDGIPLFSGIEPRALEGIVRAFRRAEFDAGAVLMRQGQPADSAFILESGVADVITALPGGGEAVIATLGPGAVMGEMALLESGTRSATVAARERVTGWFLDRDGFRMLIAQRDPAVFRIRSRITRALCGRLRTLNARIVAADAPGQVAPPLPGQTAEPGGMRRGVCAFNYRAFLPRLPVFRRFSERDIDECLSATEVIELDRGRILFHQDDAAAAAFLVVRGALEVSRAEGVRRHRIGILGPGRLVGLLALIEGAPHSMSAAARESLVLVEIPLAVFQRLMSGREPSAARFQDAIDGELLQTLTRTNNHLARLISLARIRGGAAPRADADALQRVLSEQDCRPGEASLVKHDR
jgi:CRP/FNR family transcriptional regulator, cyclic AMP receptor protein